MTQTTAVAKQEQQRTAMIEAVSTRLTTSQEQVATLLPPDVPQDAFLAATWLYLKTAPPRLVECQPAGIVAGIIKAAMDGFLLGRDAYILPFKGTAQYIRDYRGLIRLLERTGKVKRVFAHPVYARDTFDVDYFQTPTHKPWTGGNPGDLRCVYAYVEQKDGSWDIEVMDVPSIERIRERAPGGEQDAWLLHFEQMACKTVLKRLCKRLQWIPLDVQHRLDAEDRPPTIPQDRYDRDVVDLFGDGPRGYQHAPTDEHASENALEPRGGTHATQGTQSDASTQPTPSRGTQAVTDTEKSAQTPQKPRQATHAQQDDLAPEGKMQAAFDALLAAMELSEGELVAYFNAEYASGEATRYTRLATIPRERARAFYKDVKAHQGAVRDKIKSAGLHTPLGPFQPDAPTETTEEGRLV